MMASNSVSGEEEGKRLLAADMHTSTILMAMEPGVKGRKVMANEVEADTSICNQAVHFHQSAR